LTALSTVDELEDENKLNQTEDVIATDEDETPIDDDKGNG